MNIVGLSLQTRSVTDEDRAALYTSRLVQRGGDVGFVARQIDGNTVKRQQALLEGVPVSVRHPGYEPSGIRLSKPDKLRYVIELVVCGFHGSHALIERPPSPETGREC
ncbi:hypothetical protein [Bradyrhizobium sp. LHD-71]|uniref:hypothetical protein n=1 Tax=Bradyrhizobium sp. LHD-71 TaxID=3072141 RepID=UPI002810737D|nr:hypothetical protein [Bradyrhizobium sp. LHD-71]MDQ8729243.1 hypothetical protein [Bradyrhizobium sp. LHD-71]